MKNPVKMDDLGVPLFLETSISPPGAFDSTQNPHDGQTSSGAAGTSKSLTTTFFQNVEQKNSE